MSALLQSQPEAATVDASDVSQANDWPLHPASLRDPYPQLRAWREAGPLHWTPHLFDGAWVLTRHADCEAALRDPHLSAQRTGGWVTQHEGARREWGAFQQLFARALLFVDPPDHTRLRRLMQPAFTPAAMQRLRAHIEADCAELIDSAEAHARKANDGAVDVVATLARPLPARVIARVLGLTEAEGLQCLAWSADLAALLGAAQPNAAQARRAQVALLAMTRRFDSLLAERRAEPRQDLLSHLAAAQTQGQFEGPNGGMTELLAQCAMLLFAGHETTRYLLGNAIHSLLQQPSRWADLRARYLSNPQADPTCLGPVVRELLRLESPVQYTGRRVTRDMQLHGQPLQRGDLLILHIGAANRDPAQHPQPDELDLNRPPRPSLAFGLGAHNCLGSALSQMEAEVLLGQLLQRWPAARLRDAEADWLASPLYRGLGSLWVRPG